MRIFKSAFEKLSIEHFGEISESTKATADTLTPGGDLFELVNQIASQITRNTMASGINAVQDALVLKLLGKSTISNIGKSFQVLIDALNSIDDTKEAGTKMKILTEGLSSLTELGGGLVKFALSMMIAGPLLLLSLPSMIVSIPIIMGIVHLFKWIDKQGISESVESVSKAFAIMGLGLVSLALGVLAVSYILPPTDPKTWLSIAMTGALVFGLVGVFKFADSANMDKTAPKVSIALAIMGGAITALALSIKLFQILLPPDANSIATIGMVVGTIGALGLTMGIVGIFKTQIIGGSLALLVASGAIAAIGIGISIFAKAVPPTSDGWITIGQISAAILGIGLVMALAGIPPVPAAIALGAVSMMLAGFALISISFGIKEMSKVFSGNGIDGILADSGQVTEGFLGFGAGRPMSRLEWMMLSIARSFALPPAALIGLAAGVGPMMLAGSAMIVIGKGIEKFQQLDIDYTTFPLQMRKVVGTLADEFGRIGTQYPGGRKGLFNRIFGGGSQSPVADGISAVMGMGDALTSIALGVQSMAELKFPTEYDSQGRPTKFTTLSSDYAVKLNTNITAIVSALSQVFGEIGNDPTLGKGGRKSLFGRIFGTGGQSPVADGISAVMGMGEALSNIAKGVQSMADLKFPIYDSNGNITGYESIGDINDIEARLIANTRKLVSSLSSVFGKIGKSPDAEDPWGWFGKSNIERGVDLVQQFSSPLMTLTEAAKVFGDSNFNEATIKNKIQGLIGIFVGETGLVGKAGYEAASSMWYNIDSAFNTMGDEFENIADGINGMDLEKVKEARMLFEAIAAMSNSSRDDILRDMGDSIEGALERLAELLEDFKSNVTEGNVASQAIGDAVNSLAGLFSSNDQSGSNQSQGATLNVDLQPVADEIDNLRNLLAIQGIKIKEI